MYKRNKDSERDPGDCGDPEEGFDITQGLWTSRLWTIMLLSTPTACNFCRGGPEKRQGERGDQSNSMLKAQKKREEGPCCRTGCVAQLTRQETEEIQEETMNKNKVIY